MLSLFLYPAYPLAISGERYGSPHIVATKSTVKIFLFLHWKAQLHRLLNQKTACWRGQDQRSVF